MQNSGHNMEITIYSWSIKESLSAIPPKNNRSNSTHLTPTAIISDEF